jgi:hypothetical protein
MGAWCDRRYGRCSGPVMVSVGENQDSPTNHLLLREPPAEGCAEGFPFPALSCCAFHSAHRFRCASAMRFRASADILGRRRVTAPSTARRTPATALLTPAVWGFEADRPDRNACALARFGVAQGWRMRRRLPIPRDFTDKEGHRRRELDVETANGGQTEWILVGLDGVLLQVHPYEVRRC